MKSTRHLSFALLASACTLMASGCNKCKDEDPRARVTNNGTQPASVQVKTSGGNTININNVAPGTSSEYQGYAPGEVEFTITVSRTGYVKRISVGSCYDYDVSINAANHITVAGTDRND